MNEYLEEAFFVGFEEGLEKAAERGRVTFAKTPLKEAKKAPTGKKVRRLFGLRKRLEKAPSRIAKHWKGTQKGGPPASWKDIYEGIRRGKGEVRRGALGLLGKRALIAGVPTAAAGAGALGLRALLKGKKKKAE